MSADTQEMSRPPVIELDEVCRYFGTHPVVRAVDGVSLRVHEGESVAVVGSSGSGKSTLMSVLGLLDRPTSGTYRLEGVDMSSLGERDRAATRGSRIGFVFQSFHLLAHRSVIENVSVSEVYRGTSRQGRRERAMAALEQVGMTHRADQFPPKLSGGERQRVAIARALVGHPALLLCDEPSGNLDSDNTATVLDLFDQLVADGITLVVITHEHDVAARLGRRLHMTDGHLSEKDPA